MLFSSPASSFVGHQCRATEGQSDSQYTLLPTRHEPRPRRISSSIPRPSTSVSRPRAKSSSFQPQIPQTIPPPLDIDQSLPTPTRNRTPESRIRRAAVITPGPFLKPTPPRNQTDSVKHPSLKPFPERPHTFTPKPRKQLATRISKPDPWLLLEELKALINDTQQVLWVSDSHGKGGRCDVGGRSSQPERCICGLLDIDNILALHERDVMEWGPRRRSFARAEDDDTLHVFGVSLREVSIYASSTRIFGGYQHDLPIVIFSCVEELFRTGIYQRGLFRDLPNRERLIQLIRIFDSGRPVLGAKGASEKDKCASFGEDFSLHAESMPDICALFSTYLSSLPEPILCPTLCEAFWALCVKPSLVGENGCTDEALGDENVGRRDSSPRFRTPTYTGRLSTDENYVSQGSDESPQIRTAQILFALLPSANFSLLVYLFSFFTQIPSSCENGISFEDIARIFAGNVLGQPEGRSRGRGRSCVNNRNRSGGSDKNDGMARRMMVWLLRRWGRISNGLMQIGEHETEGRFRPCSINPLRSSSSHSSVHDSILSSPARPLCIEDEDKAKAAPDNLQTDIHIPALENQSFELLPSDRLFQMDENDDASMYSSAALDERLLDVMPPSLFLEQTLSPSSSSLSTDDHRIADLQCKLERSNLAVTDAMQQTLCARAEARQVAELAKQRACVSEVEALKKKLEIAERERDEALRLVRDAKKLFLEA